DMPSVFIAARPIQDSTAPNRITNAQKDAVSLLRRRSSVASFTCSEETPMADGLLVGIHDSRLTKTGLKLAKVILDRTFRYANEEFQARVHRVTPTNTRPSLGRSERANVQ